MQIIDIVRKITWQDIPVPSVPGRIIHLGEGAFGYTVTFSSTDGIAAAPPPNEDWKLPVEQVKNIWNATHAGHVSTALDLDALAALIKGAA